LPLLLLAFGLLPATCCCRRLARLEMLQGLQRLRGRRLLLGRRWCGCLLLGSLLRCCLIIVVCQHGREAAELHAGHAGRGLHRAPRRRCCCSSNSGG
jgi:hypothetical protein